MVSDLNMPHGKMTDFVSFPLLGFTLSHNTLYAFDEKMMSDLIMSCQTVSDLIEVPLLE